MEVHMGEFAYPPVNFETHPDQYVHWDLDIDGSIATLTMHIKEDHPMWAGLYDLKLNSYDRRVIHVEIAEVDGVESQSVVNDDVKLVQVVPLLSQD